MKIKVALSELQHSLDIITRLAMPATGNITITSDGKRVQIISAAETSRCTTTLPCQVAGEGEYAVTLASLRDSIKGRSELLLTFKNAVLQVTSGSSYKAELVTVDVVPMDQQEQEEGEVWKLAPEQSAWLRKALRDVALKPTAILSSWMPAGIKLTPNGGFVTCYDMQHMSWVSDKKVVGEFEAVLPLETITNVIELFYKAPFSVKKTSSYIEVKSKLTKVFLSVPSTDDLPSLQDVYSKTRAAAKVTGKTFQVTKAECVAFMENARAVMGKERVEICVTGKGNSVQMQVKTGQGTSSAVLAGKGDGYFKVDYEYLAEALSKADDEVTLNVVEGSYLGLSLRGLSIIVALNQ